MGDGPYKNTRSSQGKTPLIEKDKSIFDIPNTPSEQSKQRKCPRTPSGQLMSNSVRDIRNFFNQNKIESGNLAQGIEDISVQAKQGTGLLSLNCVQSNVSESVKRPLTSVAAGAESSQPESDKQTATEVLYRTMEYNPTIVMDQSITNCLSPESAIKLWEADKEKMKQMQRGVITNTEIHALKDQSQQSNIQGINVAQKLQEMQIRMTDELEKNDSENPQVMDVQLVFKMFEEIRKNMVFSEQQKQQHMRTQSTQNEEILKLKMELNEHKARNAIMSGVMQRMYTEMKETKNRVEILEIQSMKNSLVISGLTGAKSIKLARKQIQELFSQVLGVDVPINEVYYKGNAIVVMLSTIQDKLTVLRNCKKLKDYETRDGYQVYINDLLPPAKIEEKKEERNIYLENMNDSNPCKPSMELRKGKLFIDDKKYNKPVKAPTPTDILQIPSTEIARVFQIPMDRSEIYTHEGSSFFAYSSAVTSTKEVKEAYLKIKLKHPDARHLMCAYVVPAATEFEGKNFCDDEEDGAGQMILNMMLHNKIENRVIFVVRKYGGVRIGPIRFELILKVAEEVLAKNPFNITLNQNQNIEVTHSPPPQEDGEQAPFQFPRRQRYRQQTRKDVNASMRRDHVSKRGQRKAINRNKIRDVTTNGHGDKRSPWNKDNGKQRNEETVSLGGSWPRLTENK